MRKILQNPLSKIVFVSIKVPEQLVADEFPAASIVMKAWAGYSYGVTVEPPIILSSPSDDAF